MSENQKSASQQEERRTGARDRRTAKVDRRNSERLAEDIAPRRHPDVKDRRSSDR